MVNLFSDRYFYEDRGCHGDSAVRIPGRLGRRERGERAQGRLSGTTTARQTETSRETARDEILDASAELFTRHGYTGTSTRMIADAVGVRQASLYHYFTTKDDILAALLATTVDPSLDRARELLAADGPPLQRLLDLARYDVTQLAAARWNLGALYLLPELADDRFAEFRAARLELSGAYDALAADVLGATSDTRRLLPFRLVESVIMMRSDEQRGELGDHTVTGLVDTIVGAIEMLLEHTPTR